MFWQRIGRRSPLRGGDRPGDGAVLGIGVALVLAIVLTASWKTRVDAACRTFGGNFCAGPGTNPCPYTTCAATGPGYTCSIDDVDGWVDAYYKMTTQPTVWYRCSGQSNSTNPPNCSEAPANCGPITHYAGGAFRPPDPTNNCSGQTCSGSWIWNGCQGSGTWCNQVQAPPG